MGRAKVAVTISTPIAEMMGNTTNSLSARNTPKLALINAQLFFTLLNTSCLLCGLIDLQKNSRSPSGIAPERGIGYQSYNVYPPPVYRRDTLTVSDYNTNQPSRQESDSIMFACSS